MMKMKTKDHLTIYLPKRLLDCVKVTNNHVVVAYRKICASSFRNISDLHNSQEEADTKLILHAFEAATPGATYLDNTDVLLVKQNT